MCISKLLEKIIASEPVNDRGLVAKLRKLSIDKRGYVGEVFITELFKLCEKNAERNTGLRNQKDFDILVNSSLRIEVKTATLTETSKTFQHEGIERARHFDWLCCLDIAPTEIYISFFKRTYLDQNWKKLMHIRNTGVGKFDLKLKGIQKNRVKTIDNFKEIIKPLFNSIDQSK